jgi:thiol-disulfide isomerase/thioredoxin
MAAPAGRAAGRRAALASLLIAPLAVAVPRPAGAQRGTDGVELPRIDNLRTVAAQMRKERVPLLLFFSTPGCPYCIEVRRSYLAPRLKAVDSVLIREVEITSRRSFVGLDGARTTEADLANRFGVRMVPVVQLVDASLAPIGKPLIGLDASGFYESYLASAIEEAQQAMRAR